MGLNVGPSCGNNRDVMRNEDDLLKLLLASLAVELRRCNEPRFAAGVDAVVGASIEQRSGYLKSNELWGGSGSRPCENGNRSGEDEGYRSEPGHGIVLSL
jgi:hypothetical protein